MQESGLLHSAHHRGATESDIRRAAAPDYLDEARIAPWLAGGGNVDATFGCTSVRGVTMLMLASGEGQLPLVELLLKHDANVNLQDSRGTTALMDAAGTGHAAIVRRLLHAGAQPGARDHDGNTAMKIAQDEEHYECVQALR